MHSSHFGGAAFFHPGKGVVERFRARSSTSLRSVDSSLKAASSLLFQPPEQFGDDSKHRPQLGIGPVMIMACNVRHVFPARSTAPPCDTHLKRVSEIVMFVLSNFRAEADAADVALDPDSADLMHRIDTDACCSTLAVCRLQRLDGDIQP